MQRSSAHWTAARLLSHWRAAVDPISIYLSQQQRKIQAISHRCPLSSTSDIAYVNTGCRIASPVGVLQTRKAGGATEKLHSMPDQDCDAVRAQGEGTVSLCAIVMAVQATPRCVCFGEMGRSSRCGYLGTVRRFYNEPLPCRPEADGVFMNWVSLYMGSLLPVSV